MNIPFKQIKQTEPLHDGSSLVLYNADNLYQTLGQSEAARNLYRIAPSGDVMWRVQQTTAEYPHCFVEFYRSNEGKLIAYNFDCWEYEVDVESGAIKRHAFLK